MKTSENPKILSSLEYQIILWTPISSGDAKAVLLISIKAISRSLNGGC